MNSARIISVNIGRTRDVEHGSRTVATGIFKEPTTETQRVEGVHIGGDVQADTVAHGGEHKAIYAYAREDADWWEAEVGDPFENGAFGENLTTEGIDVSGARIGDRWRIGTAVLEVSEPRVPCFKLTIRTGIPRFQQTFGKADRPGAYLRIVEAGELTVGDGVEIEPTDRPTITVAEIASIYHRDRESAGRLLDVEALSPPWKRWAGEQPA